MNGEPHYTHYDKKTKLKKEPHTHTHTFTLISISLSKPPFACNSLFHISPTKTDPAV